MPIKYSFTPRELINTYNRKVMTKVAEIFESSPSETVSSWRIVVPGWSRRHGRTEVGFT